MARNMSDRRAAGRPTPRAAVAVVVSRYNGSVTSRLLDGALAAYGEAGGDAGGVSVVDAPGSFELVALCNAAARTGRYEAVVALGCIMKGETEHDRYIAQAVADGLARITVETGVPIALGVLTVNTARQARERAGGAMGNKGAEAMEAALATVAAIRALEEGTAPPGRAAMLPDKAKRNGAAPGARAARRALPRGGPRGGPREGPRGGRR
jgi:6,7-dimethyl-8-ribityllumazine synthase